MHILLVSDDESLSNRIRHQLLHKGLDCPASQVVPLEHAAGRPAEAAPDLVILALSPDPERALAALAALRPRTSAPVLAAGPAQDSRLVLRTLRGGADEYLDVDDLEAELSAALARPGHGRPSPAETGRMIAVLATSGGSGASSVAVNVAAALAREHRKALLVDLKLEMGDLAALLDLMPTHTLGDLCQNLSRLDRLLFERSLVAHHSGVHLLASPRRLASGVHRLVSPSSFGRSAEVTPEGVREVLSLGRTLFPYVVADVNPSFRREQMEALRLADVILLVLRLDFPSLANTQRLLEYLQWAGISRERVRLVVNRAGQPKEVPAAKAEEALHLKIFRSIPDDPPTMNRASNHGIPAVLGAPRAKVSLSLSRLALDLNGHHESP